MSNSFLIVCLFGASGSKPTAIDDRNPYKEIDDI